MLRVLALGGIPYLSRLPFLGSSACFDPVDVLPAKWRASAESAWSVICGRCIRVRGKRAVVCGVWSLRMPVSVASEVGGSMDYAARAVADEWGVSQSGAHSKGAVCATMLKMVCLYS